MFVGCARERRISSALRADYAEAIVALQNADELDIKSLFSFCAPRYLLTNVRAWD